jgi:hypothetical protein
MAWITWRQHRVALIGTGVLLGTCALLLGISGLRLQAAHANLVRGGCAVSGALITSRCGVLQTAYNQAGYVLLTGNILALTVAASGIPVLIGMFAGAPLLAREYEAGTFRFAWTQETSRTRWAAAKLALLGAALAVAASAFGALVSWWLAQDDPLSGGSRWQPAQFGLTPVTFAAWTLVAFAAGAFAGALIKRTVPAMAATAACVAAMAAVTYKKLVTPLVSIAPVTGRTRLLGLLPYQPGSPPVTFVSGAAVTVSAPPGSWPLRSWISGPHGQVPSFSAVDRVLSLRPSAANASLASHHLTLWTSYQPSGRFWVLQSIEGCAGLLLALLLGAATVWLVRRRAA